MNRTPTWQRLALAGALLLSVAGAAMASTITVPNGIAGGTCGAGNVNERQLGGNCGSLVTVNDLNSAYVQDNSPAAEATYRVRFYVDLSGTASTVPGTAGATRPSDVLAMTSGDAFDLFAAFDGADPVPPATAGNKAFRIEIGFNGTDYTATGYVRNDAGTETATSAMILKRWGTGAAASISSGFFSIEAEWAKSTAAGNNTGKLSLWVNGTAATGASGVDIDTSSVNYVRWGAVDGLDAGTTGKFKLDDFVSQRENYIGPAVPFSDMPTSNGFFPAVQSIFADEVIPPASAGTFNGVGNVLRKEMAKYILTSKDGTNFAPLACPGNWGGALFTDVPCSHPYANWIYELAFRGITGGCGGGAFCPDGTTTRQQMVVFIQAASASTPDPVLDSCSSTSGFGDVLTSSPFCTWIRRAARVGITSGCGGGNFCPTNPVQRQQMAVFLVQNFGLPIHSIGP